MTIRPYNNSNPFEEFNYNNDFVAAASDMPPPYTEICAQPEMIDFSVDNSYPTDVYVPRINIKTTPNIFDTMKQQSSPVARSNRESRGSFQSSIGEFDFSDIGSAISSTADSFSFAQESIQETGLTGSSEDEQFLKDLEEAQFLSVLESSKLEIQFDAEILPNNFNFNQISFNAPVDIDLDAENRRIVDFSVTPEVSRIVDSRKSITFDLNVYNGLQWNSFWKLTKQEHEILESWNPEICDRQGVLFEIVVRLMKFKFHLGILTKFYGPRFKRSKLRFRSKIAKMFNICFNIIDKLYIFTSAFLRELITQHYNGKLLVDDYLVLPKVKTFFNELRLSFPVYSKAFAYLKVLYSHRSFKEWVTSKAHKMPADWKAKKDMVTTDQLFNTYFWLTFSSVIPLFQKLTMTYQTSGNFHLIGLSSDIAEELDFINKIANEKIMTLIP